MSCYNKKFHFVFQFPEEGIRKKAVLLEASFAKALLKQLLRFLGRNAIKD